MAMAMLWGAARRQRCRVVQAPCPTPQSQCLFMQVRNAAVLFNVLDAISSLTMSCRQGQDAVAAAGAALGPLAATTPATVPVTGAIAEASLPIKDAEPDAGDSGGGGSGNSVLALLASMLGSRHTVLTSKVRRCIHLKCETGMPQLQLLLTLCLV